MRTGFYLYGFIAANKAVPEQLVGFDGESPVVLISAPEVSAVVTLIDAETFEGEGSEERLGDPEWLVPRAVGHQRVVEAMLQTTTILPVRFGTVFTGEESLFVFLLKHEEAIARFLREMADQEEWSVKGFVDKSQIVEMVIASDPELAAKRAALPNSPGTRYFLERQLKNVAETRVGDWKERLRLRVESEIRLVAPRTVPLRLYSTQESQAQEEIFLHLAVLLPKSEVQQVRQRLANLSNDPIAAIWRLESSGPWPPYSFCPVLEES
jgi:hypothetical protein